LFVPRTVFTRGDFMTETSQATSTSLTGRVVIVTGAGKGIGRAVSLQLASCGAKVLVNNRRHQGEEDEQTSAAQVVAMIRAQGGQALANHDDALDPDAGARMVEQAMNTWGRLDMVYANAAVAQQAAFHTLSLNELRTIIDSGVVSTLSLLHAAWPVFRAQRYGRALVSSSSAGRFGNHGLTAYAASKGAIESLMRSLALEGVKHGIHCNALSPYAHSQMTASHLPPAWADVLAPEALAAAAAWLLSPECTINGQVLVAGGGRYARSWPVETPSVAGTDMEQVWAQLLNLQGQTHVDSITAFQSFMADGGH
jgi:NAD(P)-dependent dehydrogenase (short-subunit alcohol dehydrogenase family)